MQNTAIKKSNTRTQHASLAQWFTRTKGSFKKIVWPTKSKVVKNALTVVGLSAAVAAFVWLLDIGFAAAVTAILSLIS